MTQPLFAVYGASGCGRFATAATSRTVAAGDVFCRPCVGVSKAHRCVDQPLALYETCCWALSTCLRCNGNSALGGSGAVEVRGSGGFRRPGDVVPGGEAVGHLGAIVIGGEPMAAGPEMRGDHAEHRQEPLGCAGGAEAFHGAFALPGRLVRVLRPVQVPRLPVLDRRHHRPMRHLIASELVGDQHPR